MSNIYLTITFSVTGATKEQLEEAAMKAVETEGINLLDPSYAIETPLDRVAPELHARIEQVDVGITDYKPAFYNPSMLAQATREAIAGKP